MRSHTDARPLIVAMALLLVTSMAVGLSAVQRDSVAANTAPAPSEITRALARVQADPNLATERTIKTLQWKTSSDPKPFDMPEWLQWLVGLFRWLDDSARVLVWVAAIAVAGALAGFVVRMLRTHGATARHQPFVAPTRVRDMDIRPETLPDDIGDAARALWDRGEHRAALALLYRGLLSRLAHVHRVPIRDASTEGDCLALSAVHLPESRHQYASRLIRVWQQFVYGGQVVPTPTVYVLCDNFAAALDTASAVGPTTSGGRA